MLLLSGLLFLLQACLLPGLLLLNFLRVRELSQVLLLAMPISLSVNYILFHFLNEIELLNQTAWVTIVAIEILILICIAWRHRRVKFIDLFRPDLTRFEAYWVASRKEERTKRVVTNILVLAAIVSLSIFLILVFYNPGFKTFAQGDDIDNWAKWAKQWASLGQAEGIYWYPQMGPITRAIGLIFLGNLEIHLFSKMIMPIFSLLMIGMFIDLETRFGNKRFLLGATFLSILIWLFARFYVDSGHMDLPTAAMLLAAIYPLVLYCGKGFVGKRGLLAATITSSLIAAGAVWTKQTGLYVLFVVCGVWLWSRINIEKDKRLPVWSAATILLAVILAAASFYIPQAMKVAEGSDVNNIPTLNSLNWRDPWFDSALIGTFLHYPFFSGIVLLGSFTFVVGKEKYFWFAPALAVTGYIIWAISFNYDIRNCFFAFPFIALSFAGACAVFWRKIGNTVVTLSTAILRLAFNTPAILYCAAASIFAFFLITNVPDSVILNRQRNANLEQLSLGIPNGLVLGVADFIDPGGKIVVTYEHSALIPETKNRFVVGWIRADKKPGEGDWESQMRDHFLDILVRPGNRFLLTASGYVKYFNQNVADLIEEAEKKKILRPVMSRYNTTLYYYDPVELRNEFTSKYKK